VQGEVGAPTQHPRHYLSPREGPRPYARPQSFDRVDACRMYELGHYVRYISLVIRSTSFVVLVKAIIVALSATEMEYDLWQFDL